MINDKYFPPHHHFSKEEPRKKEEPEKKEEKGIKEVIASIKIKEQKLPVKTKKMTKSENKHVPKPKMVQKGYPRLQHPQRALIQSEQVKKSSHGLHERSIAFTRFMVVMRPLGLFPKSHCHYAR
jgi:hypothetical protein